MFVPKIDRRWSEFGLIALCASFIAAIALAIIDGLIRGYFLEHSHDTPGLTMLATWVLDFRYVAEQVMTAAAVVFVGAKFIETRTLFTVGFDKLDTAKVALKGPDEENVVWIGHRYGSRLEAEAVAAALSERLKESAVPDPNS